MAIYTQINGDRPTGIASAAKPIPNMKLDSVAQQCILVRPSARRLPSESHLVPIPGEFVGYVIHFNVSSFAAHSVGSYALRAHATSHSTANFREETLSNQLRRRSYDQTAIIAPGVTRGLRPRLSAHDRQLVSVTVEPSQKLH